MPHTPVSARVPRSLVAFALVMAAVAGCGLWRVTREYPARWAYLLTGTEHPESVRIEVQQAISHISDSDGPRIGAVLPIAEFVQSNGRRIRVALIEGHLFGQSIEPREVWSSLDRNLAVVSSVDERRSTTGSLSGAISKGCSLPDTPGVIQPLGSSSITECRGAYREAFGVSRVARLSVIVEAADGSDRSPCWSHYGIAAAEGDYQSCVANAVSEALGELFSQLDQARDVDALVLPAIGTGVGKLSKAGFYNKLLVETLVPQLKQDHYIPPTLYLLIPRWDDKERWAETTIAIAGAIDNSIEAWVESEHTPPDSEWLSLTGVASGIFLMLTITALGTHIPSLSRVRWLVVRPTPLVLASFVAAALGLVSLLKALVALFPTGFSPYLQIAAGAVAAFLCGPLARATDALQRDLLAGTDTSDGRTDHLHQDKNGGNL